MVRVYTIGRTKPHFLLSLGNSPRERRKCGFVLPIGKRSEVCHSVISQVFVHRHYMIQVYIDCNIWFPGFFSVTLGFHHILPAISSLSPSITNSLDLDGTPSNSASDYILRSRTRFKLLYGVTCNNMIIILFSTVNIHVLVSLLPPYIFMYLFCIGGEHCLCLC